MNLFKKTAVAASLAAGLLVTTSATAAELEARLTRLYDAFQPLLNNLKKSSNKEYVYWPDRYEKIEAFQDMLDGIYKGQ